MTMVSYNDCPYHRDRAKNAAAIVVVVLLQIEAIAAMDPPIASAFGDTDGEFFDRKFFRPKIFRPKNSRPKIFRVKNFRPNFLI